MASAKNKLADSRAKAKAKAQALKAKTATVTEDTKLGNQLSGFTDFIRSQGVVGLAVGLAIGTQAGATVKALVEGFINPIVEFIVGSQEGLLNAKWNVIGPDSEATKFWFSLGDRYLVIGWGAVLSSMITLIAVAAVIYFVVKGFKLDKLDKKKD
ncbi:MscL family protein [Candidatus Saccharibacteria bacterium]|nr:MscL family protein [Candidatus Saccharibacteria bacterium]